MHNELIITIANLIFTPIIVLLTMWIKGNNAKEERRDKRDDEYLKNLEARILDVDKRLTEKEQEIKEIKVELKNRDEEYLKLYKEHTTLKAQYEVLKADYEVLKKNYQGSVEEMTSLKEDLKHKAQDAATSLKTL